MQKINMFLHVRNIFGLKNVIWQKLELKNKFYNDAVSKETHIAMSIKAV